MVNITTIIIKPDITEEDNEKVVAAINDVLREISQEPIDQKLTLSIYETAALREIKSDRLLTKRDLAQKWQVSERIIDKYRKNGIIKSVKGVPGIRFNPQHIEELEGTKLDRLSPIERKKLERKIDELEKENQLLQEITANISAESCRLFQIKRRTRYE